MEINLNDPKYGERLEVSDENILLYLNQYDIYKNYIGEFTIGQSFKSPIKEKDDNHSFGIYWSKKSPGTLLFKDLSINTNGNVFKLVKLLSGLNYYDALIKIIYDFRLTDLFKIQTSRVITSQKRKPIITDVNKIPKESDVNINVRIREWSKHDLVFWGKYGVTIEILRRYRIFPIDYIFLNDQIIRAELYSYAYYENKDGVDRYKIYQPYSKKMKWLSNFIEGTISGWEQMPESDDSLIITSSSKDMMCIVGMGGNSIAPQTETYTFKKHIVDHLYSKFPNIYIFYDYDKAGITNAYKNTKLYGFIPLFTKTIKTKDPSDHYKRYGCNKTKRILQGII